MAYRCAVLPGQLRSDFCGSSRQLVPASTYARFHKQRARRVHLKPPCAFLKSQNAPAKKLKNFGFVRNVEDLYHFGGIIGKGSFSVVREAVHKKTKERFAVKTIKKNFMNGYLDSRLVARVQHEVDVYTHLGASLNVAYLYGVYETDDSVHMVMELCTGGQLSNRLHLKTNEETAKWTVRQIIRSVAQCHAKNVIMRDVKPENFMYLDESKRSPMKAIDFGLADYCSKDDILVERCGTPVYIAPEVLLRRYGQASDLWSAGVIAYQILTGRLPFSGEEGVTLEDLYGDNPRITNKEIFRAVLYSDLDFEASPWDELSAEAKDFVKCLLERNALERPTAEEALAHPWLAPDVGVSKNPVYDSLIQRLQRFGTYGKLKQVSLRRVASFVAKETDLVKDLREAFAAMDTTGSGKMTRKDIYSLLSGCKFTLSAKETRQMMAQMEPDENGDIDYVEWLCVMADWTQIQDSPKWDDWVRRAFNYFDKDRKGWLDSQELTTMLCGEYCEVVDTVPAALRGADISGDGGLSLSEFAALMITDKHDKLEIFGARLQDQ